MKTKELSRKKSRLLRITIKKENQAKDQNNGLEAKTSKEEIRTTLMMDLREIPQLIKVSLPAPTSHMGTTIRTIEDHMINDQIGHLIETMKVGPEMDFSAIRMETDETTKNFFFLNRLKGETSHKRLNAANQEVINLTFLLPADLTISISPFSHTTNKSLQKTITRRHLISFVSPQTTIPSTN